MASLSDIPSAEEELGCYSGLYSTRALVLYPNSPDQVRRIFAHAREAGRRVTLRAGAHSFDGQALGDDLVVSMMRLNSITVVADERKVRVGPGAKWGTILGELQPLGLVPAVTVTTEDATAGGTLSGDCLSRFSPAYGREGKWIESFELLTTEGQLLICTAPPEDAPASEWTLEQRAYCGVIGGLGYLGAVLAIVYRVLYVGQTDGRIGVRTTVRKFDSVENLAADLVPRTKRVVDEKPNPRSHEKLDSIWSGVARRGKGAQSAVVLTSVFTTSPERHRMFPHRPKLAVRVLVEWLMRVGFISRLLWRFSIRFLFHDDDEYVDDLDGFTFFMDGNARAKRIAKRFGFKMRNAQQTFVIPSDRGAEGGWDQAKDDLVAWLEYAHGFLSERKLTPTLCDVLFLPKDLPMLLSASAELPGFAVSYAFETSSKAKLKRITEAFRELADVLWERFNGRVYLVKNVFASPQTLAAMYGGNAIEFFRIKRELDPEGILRNDFLDRIFGDLVEKEHPPTQNRT